MACTATEIRIRCQGDVHCRPGNSLRVYSCNLLARIRLQHYRVVFAFSVCRSLPAVSVRVTNLDTMSTAPLLFLFVDVIVSVWFSDALAAVGHPERPYLNNLPLNFFDRWNGWAGYTWVPVDSNCMPSCGVDRKILTTYNCMAMVNNGDRVHVKDDWCIENGQARPNDTLRPCEEPPESNSCDCGHGKPILAYSHFTRCDDSCNGIRTRSVQCVRYRYGSDDDARDCRLSGDTLSLGNCSGIVKDQEECGLDLVATCSDYSWVVGPNPIKTNASCGPVQITRDVHCQVTVYLKSGNNTFLVDDRECLIFGRLSQQSKEDLRISFDKYDCRYEMGEWSSCNDSCGHVIQTRTRKCYQFSPTRIEVDLKQCAFDPDIAPLPVATTRDCNIDCQYQLNNWSPCSVTCGIGSRTRTRKCVQIQNGVRTSIAYDQCINVNDLDIVMEPPEILTESCRRQDCECNEPFYDISAYSLCSKTCRGKQTRNVTCHCKTYNGSRQEDMSVCIKLLNNSPPNSSRLCNDFPCATFDFSIGAWEQCDSVCGPGMHHRQVQCSKTQGTTVTMVPLRECTENGLGHPPRSTKNCNSKCRYRAFPYGNCSVSCGGGSQTRNVVCIRKTRKDGVKFTEEVELHACGDDPTNSHKEPRQRQTCNNHDCPPQCGVLQTPRNGFLSAYNVTVGSKAYFSCQRDFVLDGAASLTCQSGFMWSTHPPSCKQRLTVFMLKDKMNSFTFGDLTSDTAKEIAWNLESLTRGQTLTSDELEAGNIILDSLVTFYEDALENERNFSIPNTYIETFVGAASNLIDSTNQNTLLMVSESFKGSLFLKTMERFGRISAYTRGLSNGGSTNYSSHNIGMAVSAVTLASVRDISFLSDASIGHQHSKDESHSVITLPATLFSTILNQRNHDRVFVSLLSLRNLKDYMPRCPTSSIPMHTTAVQRCDSTTRPRAIIMSASIAVVSDGGPYNPNYTSQLLPEAVYINYTFQPGNIQSDATCAFWQFTNSSTYGHWSSAGLTTLRPTSNSVVCRSTHFTSFSVLVAIEEPSRNSVMGYLTYIGCGISLFCLLLTLTCLVYFRSHLQPDKNFININFIISLMLALIFFLAGINQSDNQRLCKAMTVIMHYLFLSVFCWMLCEGILLLRLMLVVFDSGERYHRWYFALGWGVPIVIVAVSVGLRYEDYGIYEYCFLTHTRGLIYAFIGPMSIILLVNLIVFVIVVKTVVSVHKNSHIGKSMRDVVRLGLRSMAVLLPVLGLTWTIGVFAVGTLSVPLSYAFTVLNSLQGVFVFLFHCLLHRQIRKAFGLKIRK